MYYTLLSIDNLNSCSCLKKHFLLVSNCR